MKNNKKPQKYHLNMVNFLWYYGDTIMAYRCATHKNHILGGRKSHEENFIDGDGTGADRIYDSM